MGKLFEISGYWKDDLSEFDGYLIYEDEYEDCPEEMDDDRIFFYGLGESELQRAVEEGENTSLEFVITAFKES